MNGFPTLPTKSFEVEPDRGYTGDPESTAVATLPNDVELRSRVGEHFMLIAPIPGVDREVTILCFARDVTLEAAGDTWIGPPETWRAPWSLACQGEVVETAVDPPLGPVSRAHVVDVGVGEVYLVPDDQCVVTLGDLSAGDEIRVTCSSSVLLDVCP